MQLEATSGLGQTGVASFACQEKKFNALLLMERRAAYVLITYMQSSRIARVWSGLELTVVFVDTIRWRHELRQLATVVTATSSALFFKQQAAELLPGPTADCSSTSMTRPRGTR